MEKNYYDWLEVNINASQEIIEKAYKTLVKKYHPDLQPENKKNETEDIIKKINEAYDVLSNETRKNEYDKTLKNNFISYEEYINLYNEKINLEKELNKLKNIIYKNNYNNSSNINNKINNVPNNKNYNSKINNYSRNRKYKFQYKDFLALLITIFIIFFIGIILWHIPFAKNYIINLYISNSAFKFLIDLFLSIFK